MSGPNTWRDAETCASLFVLAFVFGVTAGAHGFLASVASEWWPVVSAAVLTVAALGCLVTAMTWNGRRGGK